MLRPPPLRLLAAALTLVGLAAAGCSEDRYRDSTKPEPAPAVTEGWARVKPVTVDFPTTTPIGDDAALPDDGKPMLVNIWASWCVPCKKELPLLQSIAAEGQFDVIGFSRDRSTENAAEALGDAKVTYGNWLDKDAKLPVALDGRIPLSAVPATALVVDGKVVAVHIGELKTRAEVLQALEYV